MRVAVLGATGVIGRALVPVLAREHEVVAVSRSGRGGAAADVVTGSGLDAALEGVDVAYHLVHSLGNADFEQRDRRAAANVAAASARAGVRHIVYLGGLGGREPGASRHLRSRRETAAVLAAGEVPLTTIGAAMVVAPGSAAFETIVALVRRLPAMVTPSWVTTPTQPIALDDVVAYLAGVAGREEAFGEELDAGGPEVMTYREMIERIAALLGRRPLIVPVPFLTPRLSALWLGLVTPVSASVARPLVEGLRSETVAQDDRIRAMVPRELMSFDEAARRALGAARPR